MYLVSFASMILQGPPNDPDGSGKVQGVIQIGLQFMKNTYLLDTTGDVGLYTGN